MNAEKHILMDAERLLSQLSVGGSYRLVPLERGKNNRVYLLKTKHEKFILKKYFTHPHDSRNRLKTEFSFSSYVWSTGVKLIPKPLTMDAGCQCALFEFIEGSEFQKDKVYEPHIVKAMDFLRVINRQRESVKASKLMNASEACFTIGDHLKCVEGRIQRLQSIRVNTDVTRMAMNFIEKRIAMLWKHIKASIILASKRLEVSLNEALSWDERYLSPSDFGFHNAILDNNNQIYFFDFEYAGWDDLAKTICDFFCQVQVPVPLRYIGRVESEIAGFCPFAKRVFKRTQLLLPAYRIKWCCLMLNEFLTVGARRRKFASKLENEFDLARKLEQATAYFEKSFENLGNRSLLEFHCS